MDEDESFDEFYAKLKDIVNSVFNLPERFHAKITVIEEAKDIDQIPLTELIGNLQTYELGLTRIRK